MLRQTASEIIQPPARVLFFAIDIRKKIVMLQRLLVRIVTCKT
jgi:hypothetical protein